VLLWESGARPVLLLNKADLCSAPETKLAEARAAAPAVELQVCSALLGSGLEALRRYLGPGQTVALVGSSGAGKSTLVNRLAGADLQRVAATRESDDRGRHTTTSRTLIALPGGGLLIDAPGLRELALWDGSVGLEQAFEEIERLAGECHFRNCRHRSEPLCAVRRALEDGSLDPERFASYAKLEGERAYVARRHDLRARLDEKRRIKKVHKAFRDPRWPG
jgi:ribosome biogenesis GTPase